MSKADVFVSVVAVLRSYARFLPAFVDEVDRTLGERYANFELVLVDNGSRDDTPAVVRERLPLLGEQRGERDGAEPAPGCAEEAAAIGGEWCVERVHGRLSPGTRTRSG